MKQCAILLAVGMAMTMTVANAQINMLHPTAEGSSIGKLQADSIFFLYADSAFGEEYFAYFYSDTVSGTGEYKDWVGRVVAQRENAYAYPIYLQTPTADVWESLPPRKRCEGVVDFGRKCESARGRAAAVAPAAASCGPQQKTGHRRAGPPSGEEGRPVPQACSIRGGKRENRASGRRRGAPGRRLCRGYFL